MRFPKYYQVFQELKNPPNNIYSRGDLSLLTSCKLKVAIVGSRKQSSYGYSTLQSFFESKTFKDCVIVTGGAYGTDIQAAKLAIQYNIPLIVVIASGVENYTPKRLSHIFHPMPKNCLLISESPGNYTPNKYDFVKRNRLIASIADLVYINEASLKSGSLHTADFALDLGKDILTLPARISDENFQGCLNLIQNGAQIITGAESFSHIIYDKIRLSLFRNS